MSIERPFSHDRIVQGPHDGKDQGASQYLAFAGANAYGGKPYVTAQLNRLGPPVTTAIDTVVLEQRTDVTEPGAPDGVALAQYNETLWFTARAAARPPVVSLIDPHSFCLEASRQGKRRAECRC